MEPSRSALPPVASPREAALTAEQLARLRALPAASQDQVMFWLLSGAAVLEVEARKRLVPPPLAPPAEAGPPEPGPANLAPPGGRPAIPRPSPVSSPREAGPAPVLTPEQQARLDALPAATRALVLTWLLTGDPILVAEACKKLAPPRPRPEAPRTLPEVLGRIREDPSFPALAADWLASVFEDRKSYSGFKARCEEAWRGELPAARLLSAYEQAMGLQARNRGAIFMVAVKRRE